MLKKVFVCLFSVVLSLSLFCISYAEEDNGQKNYINNGDFEEMDASPDYDPIGWVVKKGWFVESIAGKAASGEGYLVAIQGAEASQTVSNLPSGKYTLSAFIAPLYNAEFITVKIKSGDREEEITVTCEDMCDYYEINGFEITDGTAIITILYTSQKDFDSTAIVDDMMLYIEPDPTPTPVPTATPESTEEPTQAPADVPAATDAPKTPSEKENAESGLNLPLIIGIGFVIIIAVVVILVIKGKKK